MSLLKEIYSSVQVLILDVLLSWGKMNQEIKIGLNT